MLLISLYIQFVQPSFITFTYAHSFVTLNFVPEKKIENFSEGPMKEHLISYLKYVLACGHNQTGCFKIRVCRLHLCDRLCGRTGQTVSCCQVMTLVVTWCSTVKQRHIMGKHRQYFIW